MFVGGGALLVLRAPVPRGLLHPLEGAGGRGRGSVTSGRGLRFVWLRTGGREDPRGEQRLARERGG